MPTANANGITLTYEERGEGEPLVLISGLGMQLVGWPEGLLDRLAARGLRVITFDNRDVGLSTKFDQRGVPRVRRVAVRALFGLPVAVPYTVFDMASDVAGLLDALEIQRAHVGGISLGGIVAQAMAIRHGDRMKSLISMMSFSGGSVFTGHPRATMKLLRRPARTRSQHIEMNVDFFRTAGSTGFFRDDNALAERAARGYDRCFHPQGVARQLAAAMATADMRPKLAAVRVPTLVLHGSVDPIFRPSLGKATAKAIPGAVFRLIDGWGHDLAEGAWDVLTDAISSHVRASR